MTEPTPKMRFKFGMIVIVLVVLLCSSTMAQTRPAAAQEDNASGWKEFSSAEGQFKVSLPGTPRSDIANVGTPFGELSPISSFLRQIRFFITFPM
jgi:hypothetical protein